MKRIYLFAAVTAIALAACTKTETTGVSEGNLIKFDNAFVGNPTKAGLATDDQYGTSNLPSHFFVYANTSPSDVVFENTKVYLSNNQWVYDDLKTWSQGSTYKFTAYSVSDETGLPAENGTVTYGYDEGKLTITGYTSNDNYQRDLLLAASNQTLTDSNEPVNFGFGHALAMVKFTFQSSLGDKNPVKITGFTVSGMHTKGDVSVTTTGIEWTNQSNEDPAVAFTDNTWTEITTTTPVPSDEFVVIPQSTGTVTVNFKAQIGSASPVDLKAEINIADVVNGWESGKRYNYTATITGTDLNVIEFSAPTVDDWPTYTAPDDETDLTVGN